MSYAQTIILGNLGRDPEIKKANNGNDICKFSVATSRKYKEQEETVWYNVVCFGKLAGICGQYLAKGSSVLVDGHIKTSEYQAKDGTTKRSWELIAQNVKFVGSRQQKSEAPVSAASLDNDEIPF